MDPIFFDSRDKSLIGPALDVLILPGVTLTPNWTPDMGTNADGTPHFDYTRKQQIWKYTAGAIDAFQLLGGTDNPQLAAYFVPAQWAAQPNIQTNPSLDKVVFPYSPTPLRALAADETLVVVRVGSYFPEVWVRKGASTVIDSTNAGGGLTTEEHTSLLHIESMLKTLTGQ